MRFRSALVAATILAVPFAAKAQPVTGLYVGAGAGVNFLQNTSIRSSTANAGTYAGVSTNGNNNLNLQYNAGGAAVASVGWGFGNGLRVEVEGNYRYNRLQRLNGTVFPTAAGGDNETYGAMGNVLYDFDVSQWTGGRAVVFPYLGVGAGYAWTTLQSFKAYGTNFPFFAKTNDTDGEFAYQAIAGVAYPIPNVPGLSLTAEYRFFGTLYGASFNGAVDTGPPLRSGRTFGEAKINEQFNHSILLGVRYAFNVAPPPPPPAPIVAPAPAPARSYLVFFDWDRYNLTERARQIIREAAENSTRVQYTRIEVNGYTDTSGSAAYNQRLSVRRAEAVAAELVKDGVPKSSLSIQGFGQTHLLVPTADGVREPQNRRVEIIIR